MTPPYSSGDAAYLCLLGAVAALCPNGLLPLGAEREAADTAGVGYDHARYLAKKNGFRIETKGVDRRTVAGIR